MSRSAATEDEYDQPPRGGTTEDSAKKIARQSPTARARCALTRRKTGVNLLTIQSAVTGTDVEEAR